MYTFLGTLCIFICFSLVFTTICTIYVWEWVDVSINLTKNSVCIFLGWTIRHTFGFVYLNGLRVIRATHITFLLVNQTRPDFTLRLIWLHINKQPRISWLGVEVDEVKMRRYWGVLLNRVVADTTSTDPLNSLESLVLNYFTNFLKGKNK